MYWHRNTSAMLVVTCTTAFSAQASNDGKLYDGAAVLLCAPLFLGIEVTKALTPKTPNKQLWAAFETADVNSIKRLIKTGNNIPGPPSVLNSASYSYLGFDERFDSRFGDSKKIVAGRLHVIRYLLDEVVDV